MKISQQLLLLLTLFTILSCEKNTEEPIITKKHIKKTYIEPGHLLYKAESYTKEGIKESEIVYDTTFKDSTVIYGKYEYEYSKDNIIYCKRIFSSKGIILNQIFYKNEFDDRGNLTLSHIDDLDPNLIFYEFDYNQSKQMVKWQVSLNNSCFVLLYFHYDNDGNMISQESFNPADTSLRETTTYTYNINNQITTLSSISVNADKPWKKINYFYDENNYLIKVEEIKSVYAGNGTYENLLISTNYKRDLVGRPIEIKEDYKDLYTSYEYSSDDFFPIKSITAGSDYFLFMFSIPF